MPITNSLLALPKDERDFSLGALFTLPKLQEIPDEFVIGDIEVKDDQGDTDMCTGFTVANVSAQQEGVRLSPEYQFAKTKQLLGTPEGYGSDLRTAVQSACKYGSLPKSLSPYMAGRERRDLIADWNNWGP